MRVRAALSRDGIEVYGDSVMMNPKEQQEILLQVIFLLFIKNVKFSRLVPKMLVSKRISYQYNNFQVPPGNNIDSDYKLRVEGGHQAGHGGGAIVFENETKLEFSEQFLSVSIRYLS